MQKSPHEVSADDLRFPALTADAITLTRTVPGLGVGLGISLISTPSPVAPIARIVPPIDHTVWACSCTSR